MPPNDEASRKCILRAYGVVSLMQISIGVLLIISGLLALKYTEDGFHISRPPYLLGAFVVGVLVICAGICSVYVYITEAPLIEYFSLDIASAKRIKWAVLGNTILSLISLFCCVLGLFVCVVFAVGPCDTNMWFSKCSYHSNKTEHRALAIFITIFLCSCALLSMYASLMSCIHGWAFDINAVGIPPGHRKLSGDLHHNARPSSDFQPIAMYDIDKNHDDDMHISSKYNATSSFKQTNDETPQENDPQKKHFAHTRKQHVPGQQTQCYVDVLNDPAMKQKLKERNSRLQEQ